jgi:hypothetical protein
VKGIAIALASSVVFGALPLLGFGHYDLQPSLVLCWGRAGGDNAPLQHNIYIAVAACIILSTAITMIVGYFYMFLFIKGSHTRVSSRSIHPRTTGSEATPLSTAAMASERVILKQFVIITAVFLVCWLPALIKFILEVANHRIDDPLLDFIVCLTGGGAPAVNPFVYGIMNKRIRGALRLTISKVIPCVAPIAPSAREVVHP